MIEAGVKGYLLKSVNFDEILKAVNTVAGGGTYFCADITQQLKEDGQSYNFV